MTFRSIAGQAQVKQMLQYSLRTDRVSHAYIFHGPAGTGREQMALALAKALLCSKRGDDSCGECLECRKVEHGNHQGLQWLEPDGSHLKIDQIRQLQKEFSKRSASDARIYIMKQAERMTAQASNSLLKFLEEPGSNVIAVLITENGNALLPTIRSRAQWISFQPAPPAEMAESLVNDGYEAALVYPAVHLVAGLDAAKQLIQQSWFAELRSVVIQLMRNGIKHPGAALVIVQQGVAKPEHLSHTDELLSLIMLYLKDMIHLQCGQKHKIVYIDEADWMAKQAFAKPALFWVSCLERVVEMRKRLRFNANPQLVLEQLMVEIGGIA